MGYINRNKSALADESAKGLHYKGLIFPLYTGELTRDEQRSGYIYYAFYGGKPMTKQAIMHHADQMVARGLCPAA